MFHFIRVACLLLVAQFSHIHFSSAQVLKGQIADEEKHLLSGAYVRWPGKEDTVFTNKKGEFQITRPDTSEIYLLAGCKGFQTDTFLVGKEQFAYIEVTRLGKQLGEVVVTEKRKGSFISDIRIQKSEVITQTELTKAACCDMAGCFETQGSVQPQTTNVITNAKELRILGLSGVYNQLLIDGLPMLQGLSYTYGVNSFPASIIDKIYVAKGANSVLQGFESISGQINVITRNPEKEPVLYANAYANNFGERHLNANFSTAIGKSKKWNTILGLHGVLPAGKRDRDGDGFLDLPLLTRLSVFNRWNFGQENMEGVYAQLSFRFTKEQRLGGQSIFETKDKGTIRAYGQTIDYTQPEIIAKTGYRFNAKHAIQTQISAFGQDQKSYYGTLKYKADQQNVNLLVQHQWNWNEENTLTYGTSFRYQKLSENIQFTDTVPNRNYAGNYQTNLNVPGLFAEHSSRFLKDKLTWIAGIRLDNHQKFGNYFTPRTMFKYDVTEHHVFRGSVGTGWRQVNLFSENTNILASSRDVIFEETLKPEKALNWGLNYTYKLEKENFAGSLSADFYQTRFQNQFFPDFERNPGQAFIRNFEGKSVSNAIQIEANALLFDFLECKLAYNYLQVFRMENSSKQVLPFNPTNRVVSAISYRPKKDRWYIDFNMHWFDKQKLPLTQVGSGSERGPAFSKEYAVFNGQITYKWKAFDVYVGVENIFDFRQKQPIVGWQNPFGPNFDTSTVWGPSRGRELYIGIRWRLEKKEG